MSEPVPDARRRDAIARAIVAAANYRRVLAQTDQVRERARREYRRAVRRATDAGATRRALGRAVGVSANRIQQMLEDR